MTASLRLQPVRTEHDWTALHAIRRAVLFVPGRPLGHVSYDEDHADDRAPGNQPYVLYDDERGIGTTRLDSRGGDVGVVRLVAILTELQGQGYGRSLQALIDQQAHVNGWHTLYVNAIRTAEGYYTRTGWERHEWDAAELEGISASCVQMRKQL
ncbi:hypothetical protein GCM10007989_07940 [Devosia pacifica]|uniref:N-acetyltransferase domain-containing protein n=1 Tax=Devosia pacifica TaxID=1335967 RepID=A0A918VQG6_9HYPH|nr:GNAT family N-acetyltransferase [Devosia pacifica]GHA15574.1 hypothetical protein GCM10007989_07940 [Devosia pacifica]